MQIAGLVARRIVCFVAEGDYIDAEFHFLFIRFGIGVEAYLNHVTETDFMVGHATIAREALLAEFNKRRVSEGEPS